MTHRRDRTLITTGLTRAVAAVIDTLATAVVRDLACLPP